MPTSVGRRNILRFGIAATLVIALPGCVPFYVPMRLRRSDSVRGPISREALTFLKRSRTTRAEVLLRLDEVRDDDRQFVYTWAVNVADAGVIIAFLPADALKFEQHRLVLEFDETGILLKHDHQVTSKWGSI